MMISMCIQGTPSQIQRSELLRAMLRGSSGMSFFIVNHYCCSNETKPGAVQG